MERNDVQQAIVELRRRLGMTQQDLAIHLGKAVVTVARWETARPPRGESLAALVRMAQAAGHDDLAAVFACGLGLAFQLASRPGAEDKLNPMRLSEGVQELRRHLGESQQAFSNRLGLSISAVVKYEGGREPTGKALARLAKVAKEVGHPDLANLFARKLMEQLGLSHGDLQILADASETDNEPK